MQTQNRFYKKFNGCAGARDCFSKKDLQKVLIILKNSLSLHSLS